MAYVCPDDHLDATGGGIHCNERADLPEDLVRKLAEDEGWLVRQAIARRDDLQHFPIYAELVAQGVRDQDPNIATLWKKRMQTSIVQHDQAIAGLDI